MLPNERRRDEIDRREWKIYSAAECFGFFSGSYKPKVKLINQW